ncbi:Binding protein [Hibiscus syriacus]|uniref:Binding protein n=1 Tax=Hibiscus syriacus TaxID=106335 RepID=A0A6A2ZB84_HIBSY|nr:Binding protein [Hibiscus syriacus]
MDGIFWLEEYNGKPLTSVSLKRKAKSKEPEFIGWGSKPLIEFLDSIGRNKVYDLLETHYAENLDAWDDDFFFSSGEENLDSFVRIKSDPKSFLQKNSHQLVLVKGMKNDSGNDVNTDTVLQVSNFVKDVKISMLSDDDFSQEECEDLHQRIKKGLLKRPTVAELEAKARILHADITEHWLAAELTLLPKLIDRANEKALTMFEYMERIQLLQTPDEQERLLREVPNVIAEEVEPEAAPQDVKHEDYISQKLKESETAPQAVKHENNNSQKSAARATSEVPTDSASVEKLSILTPLKAGSVTESSSVITKGNTVPLHDVPEQLIRPSHGDVESMRVVNVPEENSTIVEQNFLKILDTTQVIDLSDDDDDDEHVDSNKVEPQDDDVGSLMWHYEDPQGDIQGPFSLISLKTWMDADYFPIGFRVWKTGQSRNSAVLLTDIVRRMFRI